MKNLKKTTVFLLFIILFFLVGNLLFWRNRTIYNEMRSGLATQFNTSCALFVENTPEKRIYRNENVGFQFTYPADTLVCERVWAEEETVQSQTQKHEVSIWKREDFISQSPRLPLLIIHIDDEEIVLLPPPVIKEENAGKLGGEITKVQKVQSSFCGERECPFFTRILFTHKGHDFLIEKWRAEVGVEDEFEKSFTFF